MIASSRLVFLLGFFLLIKEDRFCLLPLWLHDGKGSAAGPRHARTSASHALLGMTTHSERLARRSPPRFCLLFLPFVFFPNC
jgi:hypothetical protein